MFPFESYVLSSTTAACNICVVAGVFWGDFWGGYIYAGVIRLVFVHHTTFCVNSVAHFFGSHTFDDARTPKDHFITALLTLGEGYHNFHHEFPNDYRNGIRTFDYDPTKWLIGSLNAVGLAFNLKTFPLNEINKGKINMKQKKLDIEKSKLTWPVDIKTLPKYSWNDIRSINQQGTQQLIVVDGFVHNVSGFIDSHPGGKGIMRACIGTDASRQFNGSVYRHSNAARNLLSNFRVAVLNDVDEPASH